MKNKKLLNSVTSADAEKSTGRIELDLSSLSAPGRLIDDVVTQAVIDKIRSCLKGHTVLIWGSGATIPLGFPSVNDLEKTLSKDGCSRDLHLAKGVGFEKRLSSFLKQKGRSEQEVLTDRICKSIGRAFIEIEKKKCSRSPLEEEYYTAMLGLFDFLRAQNENCVSASVDILTTNYDCSWERLFERERIAYCDGLSVDSHEVDSSLFFPKGSIPAVRLVKVHGSDNWFRYDTKASSVAKTGIDGEPPLKWNDVMSPKIIIPSDLKFEWVGNDTTFANLMLAFGRIIKDADSYLTIGFGFNDSHLTPLLKQEANKGKPVVRLMKDCTLGGDEFAEGLPTCITLSNVEPISESDSQRHTRACWHEKSETQSDILFDSDLWSLTSFVKLLSKHKN